MSDSPLVGFSSQRFSAKPKKIKVFVILNIFLFFVGCAQQQGPAKISSRESRQPTPAAFGDPEKHHIVRRGETLYSIAWQHGMDYRKLARINGISRKYLIFPGQKLSLVELSPRASSRAKTSPKPATSATRPVAKTPRVTPKPIPANKPAKRPTKQAAKSPKQVARSDISPEAKKRSKPAVTRVAPLSWSWPAKGRVVTNFWASAPFARGIDIAGQKGDSVRAAAGGEVVFAGVGPKGYGNLIILRHNDELLTSYGHNQRIRVAEGDRVAKGQHIADMGSTGSSARKQTILHFQVIKNGTPINPEGILPKR